MLALDPRKKTDKKQNKTKQNKTKQNKTNKQINKQTNTSKADLTLTLWIQAAF